MRLDDVVPIHSRIALMKVDAEGAELDVLRGSEQLIRSQRPLILCQFEESGAPLYGASPQAMFDFLTGCGMRLFLMGDWLSASPPLTRATFMTTYWENNRKHESFLADAAP